jgi:hypothetical protein
MNLSEVKRTAGRKLTKMKETTVPIIDSILAWLENFTSSMMALATWVVVNYLVVFEPAIKQSLASGFVYLFMVTAFMDGISRLFRRRTHRFVEAAIRLLIIVAIPILLVLGANKLRDAVAALRALDYGKIKGMGLMPLIRDFIYPVLSTPYCLIAKPLLLYRYYMGQRSYSRGIDYSFMGGGQKKSQFSRVGIEFFLDLAFFFSGLVMLGIPTAQPEKWILVLKLVNIVLAALRPYFRFIGHKRFSILFTIAFMATLTAVLLASDLAKIKELQGVTGLSI